MVVIILQHSPSLSDCPHPFHLSAVTPLSPSVHFPICLLAAKRFSSPPFPFPKPSRLHASSFPLTNTIHSFLYKQAPLMAAILRERLQRVSPYHYGSHPLLYSLRRLFITGCIDLPISLTAKLEMSKGAATCLRCKTCEPRAAQKHSHVFITL